MLLGRFTFDWATLHTSVYWISKIRHATFVFPLKCQSTPMREGNWCCGWGVRVTSLRGTQSIILNQFGNPAAILWLCCHNPFMFVSRWMKGASKRCWRTPGPPSWRPGWCVAQEKPTSSTTTWSRRWFWRRRTRGRGSCTACSPTHGEQEPTHTSTAHTVVVDSM